jgi:TolA-binding protein
MSNRVNVDRPALTRRDQKKLRKLDDYLPTLATYNPRTLDVVALRQLALAYQAKAEALEAEATDGDPAEAKKYLAAAVAAGKVAFVDQPTAPGAGKAAARLAEPAADDLYKLAGLIGPLARDRLGDSALAAKIWLGAVGRVSASALKGQAATEAADVAVNDLLQTTAAKSLRGKARGEAASELQRVWGDYYAATGKGDAARKAYRRAEELLGSSRGYTERTAWRGAHSRSTEEFIREGRYDRAAAQLRAWQREFPADKIDGYLTLLYARYFAGRKLYPQAIAQAEQLQAVSADSPYADQLLLVAAECEERRGRVDRALATLHGLVKDYPGSPLVPAAKKQIARLEAVKTK